MLACALLVASSCGGSQSHASLDGAVEPPAPSADSGHDNFTAAPDRDGGVRAVADAPGGPADTAKVATASRFPDTTATIAVLSDQLPNMTAQQQQFAAAHYVGSQKLVLGTTRALRALNPNFVVLHYHLAMWQ